MRSSGRWIAILVMLLVIGIGGCGTASLPAPSPAGPRYVKRSTVHVVPLSGQWRHRRMIVWARGSWCWFGDPRAVDVGDETFAGWIGWDGQITIGAFGARSGLLGSRVIARLPVDDHGAPAILVEPGGRLTVFWSGHNGPTMNYRTSVHPFDVRSWGPLRHIRSQLRGPKGFTYANPVMLNGERHKLYLFWRGADWSQDYATRSATGRWSRARRLVAVPLKRPYVKVASDGASTIALAFTDGHPRGVLTSVYYATYWHGALWTASGKRIAALGNGPISPRQADLVYDASKTGVRAWVWDVALDRRGQPVIVYATFPSPSRHLYWYATWSGRRWVSHLMTAGGPSINPRTIEKEYSGGIAINHADPSTVYVSRKVARWFEIERWRTPDRGYSWQYSRLVHTRGSDNVRPVVPRGSDGPIDLLWLQGHYRGYRRYRTSIAFLR
jgi:BNR repeat-containing family member